jgi:hypothetical protein
MSALVMTPQLMSFWAAQLLDVAAEHGLAVTGVAVEDDAPS